MKYLSFFSPSSKINNIFYLHKSHNILRFASWPTNFKIFTARPLEKKFTDSYATWLIFWKRQSWWTTLIQLVHGWTRIVVQVKWFKILLTSELTWGDSLGILRWLSGKEPACQCRSCQRCGFDCWVRKIPWKRKWLPTPVFLLGKFQEQRNLGSYSPWGRKESDMTKHAQKHTW